ncbi:hypothetical protein LHYA1_G001982 [Lachnellula hyalina]|uniref:Uncharacterized protein n=1 Tax=Lachnellula hyalina TaxID=1316788 RepID=A0A8H8R596_9HELO|nr:uncharacterized protein LHYA1_G001982 [Lachnellula hyalina]TVY28598.1 hypothetical protein LHYA1_G001982 [Lachnellula hyalina]
MSAQYSSSSSSSASSHHHQSQNQQYYLLATSTSTSNATSTSTSTSSNTTSSGNATKEIERSWTTPYAIEDEDLVFDGKPLNMLYEENRECETRDKGEKRGRGRSRKK